MKRGGLCSAVLSQEVALNSVKLQLQIDVFHGGTGQSHKNTQEEERQGRDLPPYLKGTEITQQEQAKTVNGAHGQQKHFLFPYQPNAVGGGGHRNSKANQTL